MTSRIAPVLAALLFASAAQADIYKCDADDGSVAYSQVPCTAKEITTVRAPVKKVDDVVDCRWASRFASDAAGRMREGLASNAAFDSYGGLDALSSGTVNIINYVYRFRGNESVPIERISSLAASMCKAGSLGDVRCEALPYGQDTGENSCSPDDESVESRCEGAACNPTVAAQARLQQPASTAEPERQNDHETRARNDEARAQCKKNFRDQIDAIDAQMRQGYDSAQGERYRERLRMLTTRLRDC